MEYGKKSRQTLIMGGVAVSEVLVNEESIRISSIDELRSQFEQLISDYEAGKLINPGIQMEVYPDTGKIKRVVKCWSERV